MFGKKNFFEVNLSHPLERRKKVFGAIPRTNFFKTKKFRFVLNRIFFECSINPAPIILKGVNEIVKCFLLDKFQEILCKFFVFIHPPFI